MKVTRVASYQTTDGHVFPEKKDAQQHQKQIDREQALVELVSATYFPNTSLSSGFALREVTVGDVARFILDNADAIRSILPQRAKAEAFVADLKQAMQGQQPAPATVQ